jgi:hypothetical protein
MAATLAVVLCPLIATDKAINPQAQAKAQALAAKCYASGYKDCD